MFKQSDELTAPELSENLPCRRTPFCICSTAKKTLHRTEQTVWRLSCTQKTLEATPQTCGCPACKSHKSGRCCGILSETFFLKGKLHQRVGKCLTTSSPEAIKTASILGKICGKYPTTRDMANDDASRKCPALRCPPGENKISFPRNHAWCTLLHPCFQLFEGREREGEKRRKRFPLH